MTSYMVFLRLPEKSTWNVVKTARTVFGKVIQSIFMTQDSFQKYTSDLT